MFKKLLFLFVLFVGVVALIGFTQKSSNQDLNSNMSTKVNSSSASNSIEDERVADKIEVIHFHATQQCWSCITVGEYALKTIREKFPEEYANGTIVFKDVNGELLENKEMVMKYQARGSSLFVNSIIEEEDNIKEDVTVWRLINNESQFVSYFENKLNKLLGK